MSGGGGHPGADQIRNGLNHGPFGEKNFFIPNGHGPTVRAGRCGASCPSREARWAGFYIIEAGGGRPVTRVLDQAGYLAALRVKLVEEAGEARAAPDGQLQSELADVLEVLRALTAAPGRLNTAR